MCFVSLLILGSVSKNLKPVSKFGQIFLSLPGELREHKEYPNFWDPTKSLINHFLPWQLYTRGFAKRYNLLPLSLSLTHSHTLSHSRMLLLKHQLSLTYTPTSTLSQTRTPPHSPFSSVCVSSFTCSDFKVLARTTKVSKTHLGLIIFYPYEFIQRFNN